MSENSPAEQLLPENNTVPKPAYASTLNGTSSIQAALGAFEQHMREEGFAVNTVKSFGSDIRLFSKYMGAGHAIGQIGTSDLNKFLHWLVYERGVPCSPKSYARRVTTLKVFFSWLQQIAVLPTDPAGPVVQMSVTSPIPTLPTEAEVHKALQVSQQWRTGEDTFGHRRKADSRPHLLLTLLLQTGCKKSEIMGLVLNHVERDDPAAPQIFIRYKNPRLRYKERKLAVEPSWLETLDEYIPQYEISDAIFTCTPRNLEYVLQDVSDAAGLERGLLSFENLRWTSALIDLKNGMELDLIREKLGISKITWRETKFKLEKLREKWRQAEEGKDEG